MRNPFAHAGGLASVAVLAAAAIGAVGADPAGAAIRSSTPASRSASVVVGHVYEATNGAGANQVRVFNRLANGHLVLAGSVATGGQGAGVSLASQGGLVRAGHLIFVVNAGDNTLSTLAMTSHGLVWRSTVASGGVAPISVTARDGVAYVVNRTSNSITGFGYGAGGRLWPLPQSTRALSSGPAGATADAAEIAFQPDGEHLLVTERATDAIESFPVSHGYAGKSSSTASAGATPYGFGFDGRGHVLVSEAVGSASSYAIGPKLRVISGAVSDTQAAPCWLVTTPGAQWAFVVNAASGTVSSYAVSRGGVLTLVDAEAAATGASSGPTDAAVSSDGRTLSVRLGDGSVASFGIHAGGVLTSKGTVTGGSAVGSAGLASD